MTLWRLFLRQIGSPFDALLVGVAVLAILLHQAADATIVLAIVAASTVLGMRNEYRAERTIAALRSRISRCANVVRGSDVVRVDVAELKGGEAVLLRTGDIVPADLRITSATALECDESVLTGEALPVAKREGDAAYMGTAVSGGAGAGMVVAVGAATRYGEIARRAREIQPRTRFEQGLGQFTTMLLYITVLVSSSVFFVSVLLHRPLAESLLFAL
ncbi:MAG TPA: hypothetical protein VFA29_05030, partial [Candidatus Baltobacteraceae bacterium]|nr:hypothetical protein [Candidatus Baltobacteraceae bacterium]